MQQVLAARLQPRAKRADRVGGEVVEEEVLVRDHPERAEPLAAEETALLECREAIVVAEEVGQEVARPVVDGTQPAEVVEAEVVEPELLRIAVERGRHAPAESRRRVADADRAVAELCADRLGHEPRRIREVDEPCLRRALCDPARELDHHGNGPQREAQAARPGRLLADDSLVERDALVDDAALEVADADRAEDEVGAVEGVVEVASSP